MTAAVRYMLLSDVFLMDCGFFFLAFSSDTVDAEANSRIKFSYNTIRAKMQIYLSVTDVRVRRLLVRKSSKLLFLYHIWKIQ